MRIALENLEEYCRYLQQDPEFNERAKTYVKSQIQSLRSTNGPKSSCTELGATEESRDRGYRSGRMR